MWDAPTILDSTLEKGINFRFLERGAQKYQSYRGIFNNRTRYNIFFFIFCEIWDYICIYDAWEWKWTHISMFCTKGQGIFSEIQNNHVYRVAREYERMFNNRTRYFFCFFLFVKYEIVDVFMPPGSGHEPIYLCSVQRDTVVLLLLFFFI